MTTQLTTHYELPRGVNGFDSELWQRITALSFDAPHAQFCFANRLARDNGWTRKFANRVINEYRRFAYLARTAGHEVTPSDEVDQAWHLHLTYTRHYWGPFTQAFGAPLHHGPTIGGPAERERYAENYDRTLASYAAAFGAAPPADIWPAPARRFGDAPLMQRVNLRRHRLVENRPHRRGRIAALAASGIGLTSILAAAATEGGTGSLIDRITTAPKLIIAVFALGVLFLLVGASGAFRSSSKSDKSAGSGYAPAIADDNENGSDSSGSGDGGSGCGGGCGGCGG